MEKFQNVAIIDIGSNSVRERISCNGKVFLRRFITTQLAKNAKNGLLCEQSIVRTFSGVDKLISLAKENNAKVFAFATAAVRNAVNANYFINEFFNRYGILLDVLSGEREGQMGVWGALKGKNGCIIDVGGASSEIVYSHCGEIKYSHSMQVGAVSLTDRFARDFNGASNFLNEKIDEEFAKIPNLDCDIYGIGGSANITAFISSGLKQFDREKTNGLAVDINYLRSITQELYQKSGEQIVEDYAIDSLRAKVIHSGALLLTKLLEKTKKDKIILTEDDNLEGYYLYLEQSGKI